jgi:hypothetical protein
MQIKTFIEIGHLMVVADQRKGLAEFVQLLLQGYAMVMGESRGKGGADLFRQQV